MLIYFEKQKVAINMQNVVSIKYDHDKWFNHYLRFYGRGMRETYIDIPFDAKEEALSTLNLIVYEYGNNPHRIMTIHTDE